MNGDLKVKQCKDYKLSRHIHEYKYPEIGFWQRKRVLGDAPGARERAFAFIHGNKLRVFSGSSGKTNTDSYVIDLSSFPWRWVRDDLSHTNMPDAIAGATFNIWNKDTLVVYGGAREMSGGRKHAGSRICSKEVYFYHL